MGSALAVSGCTLHLTAQLSASNASSAYCGAGVAGDFQLWLFFKPEGSRG
jgi:hypothetical protein